MYFDYFFSMQVKKVSEAISIKVKSNAYVLCIGKDLDFLTLKRNQKVCTGRVYT